MTRPDVAGWAVAALVSALVFMGWVIASDLRTSRLRSLILALAAWRVRSAVRAVEPEADGGVAEAGELSPGRWEGASWTDRFRRRMG
jgi:hypothetical protein